MVTISDVAAKAGVSRATVSYVLNDRNTSVRISQDTRSRVLATAASLGYRRNELARAVTTGKNPLLGFWVMQANREPVVRMLSGAMQEADARGYFIKMFGFDETGGDNRVLDRCLEWRISGIIAIHAPEGALRALGPRLEANGLPLVTVDGRRPAGVRGHICSNGAAGVRAVVHHLADLGHRSIAFIAGEPGMEDSISQVRCEAYARTMEERGLGTFQRVAYGYWEAVPTENAARALLTNPKNRPTAILCASDHTAMVVVRTAAQLGLRVPHDLSVAGFDDLLGAGLYNPSLTTVAQSFETMGQVAVRHLVAEIQGAPPASGELLPTRLVVRNSTGPAG